MRTILFPDDNHQESNELINVGNALGLADHRKKINFIAAIKDTEKFVNEDRYENRFLGEVQELKDKKRIAVQ